MPWSNGTGCHDLCFLNVEFQFSFSLSSFTFIKRLFSTSLLSAIRVVSSAYLRLLIFLQHCWFQLGIHPAQHFAWYNLHIRASLVAQRLKASACDVGDQSSIPGLGRSPGEGSGNPLQYFLPGKSHGWRNLVGYRPWGSKEPNTTERLHFH